MVSSYLSIFVNYLLFLSDNDLSDWWDEADDYIATKDGFSFQNWLHQLIQPSVINDFSANKSFTYLPELKVILICRFGRSKENRSQLIEYDWIIYLHVWLAFDYRIIAPDSDIRITEFMIIHIYSLSTVREHSTLGFKNRTDCFDEILIWNSNTELSSLIIYRNRAYYERQTLQYFNIVSIFW